MFLSIVTTTKTHNAPDPINHTPEEIHRIEHTIRDDLYLGNSKLSGYQFKKSKDVGYDYRVTCPDTGCPDGYYKANDTHFPFPNNEGKKKWCTYVVCPLYYLTSTGVWKEDQKKPGHVDYCECKKN
jgi:hypothetical protein